MSLDNFYKLRNDFLIVGLTGRMGGGCNDICDFLTKENNPFSSYEIPKNLHVNEIQKFNICKDLLTHETNQWKPFQVIKYKNVILLFIIAQLYESLERNFDNLSVEKLKEFFKKIYDSEKVVTPRVGQEEKTNNLIEEKIFPFLNDNKKSLCEIVKDFNIKNKDIDFGNFEDSCGDSINTKKVNLYFYDEYNDFCANFFTTIEKTNPVARQLLLQDASSNLRCNGSIFNIDGSFDDKNIYKVAEVIKNLIKIKKKEENNCRLVIDSLKNSLEINYFRERYSGFYLVSSNREKNQRDKYINKKIKDLEVFDEDKIISFSKKLIDIDKEHYKINDFKRGEFSSTDLENCIQKADYYIYVDKTPIESQTYNSKKFDYLSLELQILKFLALVFKPGIVTPSALERNMQLAFSSKYNSGCISRQVGAVITDEHYSVKSIGWNEVPQGQTPCSLRNLEEFYEITKNTENIERENVYTKFEREGGDYEGKTFKQKIIEVLDDTYENENNYFNNLNGHNCPFCFKELHNAFEGEKNQVHTRSLHAEENAMMQISKNGGQALRGGNLFTTASPCELCSKKAYQLGIVNIFYIDPYPGIAIDQVLKAGNNDKTNPNLYMFQGAVGRGYFKLYEPYMSLKDESKLRMNLKVKNEFKLKDIKESIKDHLPDSLKKILDDKLKNSDNPKKEFIKLIEKGLSD